MESAVTANKDAVTIQDGRNSHSPLWDVKLELETMVSRGENSACTENENHKTSS